jgi:ribonuclease HII
MPNFSLENAAGVLVVGIDEAGRGPWAGPVVAGAVIIDKVTLPQELRLGLDDSKKLKPAKRKALFQTLQHHADIGVGVSEVDEIDKINILQATLNAMSRAVDALIRKPDVALVDGNYAPNLSCSVQCIVKGDELSLSIAAASIVAKVTRDKIMENLANKFPGYGWESNFGYGTKLHQGGLKRLGVTPHHRRSFKPIIKILGQESS